MMTLKQLLKHGSYSLISSLFVIMPLSADINAPQANQAQVTTSANGGQHQWGQTTSMGSDTVLKIKQNNPLIHLFY